MNLFAVCTEKLRHVIHSLEFKIDARKNPNSFTRQSKKLCFVTLVSIIIHGVKKSTQTELNHFFGVLNILDNDSIHVTAKAFSLAREKLLPDAFSVLNDEIIHIIYNSSFKTFRDYRLLAIDGSTFEVPNIPNLQKHFGVSKNQSETCVARAAAAVIYDPLNDIVLESTLDKYPVNERLQAINLIDKMNSKRDSNQKPTNDIYLLDRGYPSVQLIEYLHKNGSKFVMRCSSSFLKVISEADSTDQIIEGIYRGKIPNPNYREGNGKNKTVVVSIPYKVRVIKLILASGEKETLITNIFDEDYTVEDFKKLYFCRWGIESKYDILKNRLQIENFSGQTTNAILQDYYASILLSNLVALAKAEADEMITKSDNIKRNKHKQQANINQLIPLLLPVLKECINVDDAYRRNKLYDSMIKLITKHKIPIRENRTYKRVKKKSKNKYHQNTRCCI